MLKLEKKSQTTYVTVFSADMIGSTALIQNMEPQEVADFLDPVLDAMINAVHKFGGLVIRSDGDGIKAVFGTEGGEKEGSAINAVHAGGSIIKNIQRLKFHPAFEKEIDIRIGLHSGDVLVRRENSDFGERINLVGKTIHFCSKVENSGNPNVITMSHETFELVRKYFNSRKLQSKVGTIALYEIRDKKSPEIKIMANSKLNTDASFRC